MANDTVVENPVKPDAAENVVAYVRPHDIEISRVAEDGFTILATIQHINAAGPLVRVQLQRHDNREHLEAELTRDRYRQLNLQNHESVYLRVRNPRVFVDDYVI